MRITEDFLKKTTGEYDLEVVQWLELPNKGIKCIEHIQSCTSLRTLTLTGNQITKICGLDGLLSLERLDLSSNCITRIENLEHLTNLQSLDLKDNKITNVDDVSALTSGYQSEGNARNPACQHPAYHVIVTRLLPKLEVLDGESLDLRKTHGEIVVASLSLLARYLTMQCMADVVLESATPDDEALKSPRQQRWCEGFDWTPYPTDSEIEEGLCVETDRFVDLLRDCERISNRAKVTFDEI